MILSHFNFPCACNSSFDLSIKGKRGGGRSRGDAHTFFKERQGKVLLPDSELPLQDGGPVLRLGGSKGFFARHSPPRLTHTETIATHKQSQQFCVAEHLNCNITSKNIIMAVYHQHKLLLECCISEHSLVG